MFSCSNDPIQNNCFNGVSLNEVLQLNNPEFIDLQVPNGYTTTRVSGRNVLIIRGNSVYYAYDLECPEKTCTTPMSFNGVIIKCSCDDNEYNYLSGGAPIDGDGCGALAYNTRLIGNNSLQISR